MSEREKKSKRARHCTICLALKLLSKHFHGCTCYETSNVVAKYQLIALASVQNGSVYIQILTCMPNREFSFITSLYFVLYYHVNIDGIRCNKYSSGFLGLFKMVYFVSLPLSLTKYFMFIYSFKHLD